MEILGVQIIASLFAFFMIYVAFLHFKRKEITTLEFSFWLLLWFGFIGITIYPFFLTKIIQELFITRIMDFLMIIAFMILSFLGFGNFVQIKKLNRKIEKVVRKETLDGIKKK